MKTTALAIILASAIGASAADNYFVKGGGSPGPTIVQPGDTIGSITFHEVDRNLAPHKVFEMGYDACLRGPLTIYAPDGSIAFQVFAGFHFPAGCEERR